VLIVIEKDVHSCVGAECECDCDCSAKLVVYKEQLDKSDEYHLQEFQNCYMKIDREIALINNKLDYVTRKYMLDFQSIFSALGN